MKPKQITHAEHRTDADGNPAGGVTNGIGFTVVWQKGPLVRDGERVAQNGAFVEGVLEAALDRLQWYQSTRFSCRENALAITKLEEALHWLNARTQRREDAGTEGTHTGT